MKIYKLKKFETLEITGRGTVFTAHREENEIEGIDVGSTVLTDDDNKFYEVVGIEHFRGMSGSPSKNIGILVKELDKEVKFDTTYETLNKMILDIAQADRLGIRKKLVHLRRIIKAVYKSEDVEFDPEEEIFTKDDLVKSYVKGRVDESQFSPVKLDKSQSFKEAGKLFADKFSERYNKDKEL